MDFSKIFNGEALTLEQFTEKTKDMKLADLSTGDYVAKGKHDSEVQKVKAELTEAKNAIATLEANKGDTEALTAELQKYKDAEEKRQKEAQEAEEKAKLDKRFAAVRGDREFASEYAEKGVLAAFRDAIADPNNTGKGDNELFDALTKDKDGIFKPAHQRVNMGGVKKSYAGKTKEEIDNIKDPNERQNAIVENHELYGI